MADWYNEEYEDLVWLIQSPLLSDTSDFDPASSLNSESSENSDKFAPIDWRQKRLVVSDVRDMTEVQTPNGQKHVCANSYAQAVTQLLESFLVISFGTPINLSVQ